MCFSAQASFTASLVLLVVAVAALKKVRVKEEYPLAAVPLLFAIQQFTEGVIWLAWPPNTTPAWCHLYATYAFLFFALMVWPVWIPFSLYLIEKNNARKKLLWATLIFGIIWTIGMLWALFYFGAQSAIASQHVLYTFNSALDRLYYFHPLLILYCIGAVVPFFLSTKKWMWLFGLAATGSLLLSYLLWYQFLISVWCFFAAILSIFVVVLVDTK